MTKIKAKIALIIPYFGQLPSWFPYFLRSVEYNHLLDVLLFTDCNSIVRTVLPDNVHVFPSTLEDISTLASLQLSIPIKLGYPYKLCDLKPAF